MQHKPLRRKDRQLADDETLTLIQKAEYGVLATSDKEGQPYGVPLSYVYLNEKIYFHCASIGHKIDNIRENQAVCFTIVGNTQPVYTDDFSTYYESAIIFGSIHEITEEQTKYDALYALAEKYLPDFMHFADKDIRRSFTRTAVYAITPDSVCGKAKKKKGTDS